MIRYTFFTILLFLGLAFQAAGHNTIPYGDTDIAHRVQDNIELIETERMGMFSAIRDDDDDDKRKVILKAKKACLKKIKALKKKGGKPCRCPRRGDDDDDDDDFDFSIRDIDDDFDFSIRDIDDDDKRKALLKVKKACLKKIKALKKKGCKCPRRGGRGDDFFDDDR